MGKIVLGNRLKIGEVAANSGISVKTIRYYEDIGLLAPTVERSDTGYRMFQLQVLKRLEFIKRAQSLGLRLQEIQRLLAVHDHGELPCPEVKQQLQAKTQAIATRLKL
jgi:DNA-binding transcriptional MerR regulator